MEPLLVFTALAAAINIASLVMNITLQRKLRKKEKLLEQRWREVEIIHRWEGLYSRNDNRN